MPPTTMPTSAGIASWKPNVGVTSGRWTTTSTVAAAARTPPMRKAIWMTLFARTPSMRAVRKSCAAARIWSPVVVRLRNSVVADRRTMPTPIDANVTQRIRRSPISTARLSSGRKRALSPSAPKTSSAMLCSRKLKANVVTSIVAGEALRIGRSANSIARANTITVTKRTTIRTPVAAPRVRTSEYAPAVSSSP